VRKYIRYKENKVSLVQKLSANLQITENFVTFLLGPKTKSRTHNFSRKLTNFYKIFSSLLSGGIKYLLKFNFRADNITIWILCTLPRTLIYQIKVFKRFQLEKP
jgi:hypothetical protein